MTLYCVEKVASGPRGGVIFLGPSQTKARKCILRQISGRKMGYGNMSLPNEEQTDALTRDWKKCIIDGNDLSTVDRSLIGGHVFAVKDNTDLSRMLL